MTSDICTKNAKTLNRIEEMLNKKLDVKAITTEKPTAINLCEKTEEIKDISINYTYMD